MGDACLVVFCRCEDPGYRDGVRFVSAEGEVMDWILSEPGYARALWGADVGAVSLDKAL